MKEGLVAVFNSLRPDVFYATDDTWELIVKDIATGQSTSVPAEVRNELIKKRILVANEQEDEKLYQESKHFLDDKLNNTRILYLMLAQDCNFACDYCVIPAQAKQFGAHRLTLDHARKGIDAWSLHLRDCLRENCDYYVIFYGGEPLLNRDVLVESVAYIELRKKEGALPERTFLMISTNGVLMDDELIMFIKEHNVSVAIGLDGSKATHDKLRHYADGQPSYDETILTIRKLREAGVTLYASVTLTPETIAEAEEINLSMQRLGIEKFGFNSLKGKYLQKMKEGFLEDEVDAVMEKGRGPVGEYQMEKKQSAFINKDWYPFDCTCYGSQLVIRPDGSISNCPFTNPRIAHVDSLDPTMRIWNSEPVKEWRQRLPLLKDKDNTYAEKSLCGGGCAWSSLELTGSPHAQDAFATSLTKKVFGEIIWSNIENQRIYGKS